MMNHLDTEDPILHSISCEIHRLILKPSNDGFLGFTDEIMWEEMSTYFMIIKNKMPYLDNKFIMQELQCYLRAGDKRGNNL